MPDLYDIDYDQQATDLLPPDKRTPENLGLLRSLFKAIQWSRDLVLGAFKSGSSAPVYVAGTYQMFDQVRYDKKIFESIIDNNTDAPSVITSWREILPNFIGVDERIKYNGQVLVLTWALNMEFGGVFRQPVTGLNSDIYLVNLAAVLSGFRLGDDESGTGASSIGDDIASDSIGGNYPFVLVNNFTIMFPAALHSVTNDEAIRNFANKYIPVGINYTITVY